MRNSFPIADGGGAVVEERPCPRVASCCRFDAFEIKGTLVGGNPGDFNTDGSVDGEDFLRWQRGLSPIPVSATDLAAWKGGFATAAAAAGAVPEPAAGVLLLLGGIAGFAVRLTPARRRART